MRRLFTITLAVLAISATASAFECWLGPDPEAGELKTLLEAPAVFVGQVEVLHHRGKEILRLAGPTQVEVLDASITIRQVIRGKNPGKAILVRRLLKASNPHNDTVVRRQIPQARKTYLFFLSPGKADNEFDPINPTEFAFETGELPTYEAKHDSTEDTLRRLAKKNIDSAREGLAARWFGILSEVYEEKEDLQFLLDKARDPRPYIQGNALAVLCEHSPNHPSLYTKAVRFVKNSSKVGNLFSFRRRISKCLPRVLGHDRVTKQVLLDWMSSGVPELSRVGFGIAETRRDRTMADGVVKLMLATKDRMLQYSCIRALSATWRDNRRLPAVPTFLESPDNYVRKWSVEPGNFGDTDRNRREPSPRPSPEALREPERDWREARAAEKMGQRAAASALYGRIVKEYPGTSFARRAKEAKERLDAIER